MKQLTAEEIRIIGTLVEKEHTTPEYYPMTINSLVNACNQKSSRFPVVSYSETIVEVTVQNLRDRKFIAKITGAEHRVPKYKQIFTEFYELTKPEIAVLCILFLRGPQTVGEIRGRSSRIYNFSDLSETEQTLDKLLNREDAFVIKLPKESGRENRYAHLFSGVPETLVTETEVKKNLEERVITIEEENKKLLESFNSLKEEFEKFKKEFE